MSVPVALRLRPLEIGDLLDETFRLYRRHFVLLAGISVILAVPSAALFGLAFGAFSSAVTQNGGFVDVGSYAPLLTSFAIGLLVGILILPFTHSAVMYAASESALGRPVTAGGVFRAVTRRYFPLLAYWLIFNVYTAYFAAALCLFPLIFWFWGYVGWLVVVPAMFVENIGLGAAFSRSWHLVQGRWWRTFLIVLLLLVVYFVVQIGLGAFVQLAQYLLDIFVSPFIAAAVSTASAQLVSALVTPIIQIAVVLVYFDLRVRKEALDLFQMAYRLASPQVAT
ncbi:MAG: hypothetical protein E6I50_00820 [Chloroflexi bacterium]|nr:MAG: hypothetical protein E6I50_00820 [Chloroflexota bacterium]